MALLKVKSGWKENSEFPLTDVPQTIGRNRTCQIRINGHKISRDHAVLEPKDGTWTVRDLNSRNGTFVNGQKIEQHALVLDDELQIGDVLLVFVPDENALAGLEGLESLEDEEPPPPTIVAERKPAPPTAPPPRKSVSPPREAPVEFDADAISKMKAAKDAILHETGKVIVGQTEVLDQILTAMLARGHCLMVGVPGLAKTLTVRTISEILDLEFRRVQFTPDLMPSDITGTDILEMDENTGAKNFRFIKGPIFTNMLLADEINRTPPKTQASLLEAMQERSVTTSGQTYNLDAPFFVLATQNPLEQEGTYPLPEAQLDRFMFNIIVDYPLESEEEDIVRRTTQRKQVQPRKILNGPAIVRLQKIVWEVPVSDKVIRYATALVRASRPGADALDFIQQCVQCGAGPRACQYLILGAKAQAVLDGRLEATVEDVKKVAEPVLRHRIFVNFNALSEGVTATDLVSRLLESTKVPEDTQPIQRPAASSRDNAKALQLSKSLRRGEKVDISVLRQMRQATRRIREEVQKVIVGQQEVLELILMSIISKGHCLMVGVPGLAKTLTVRTIASVLALDFNRIQFTPDLMPSDITGTDILEEDEKTGAKHFRFIHGPIFTNMLLADEINRTPPKTQAALLEAMQEHDVTVSGTTYHLNEPFFVLATQNPLEQEGTYPLPEAQLDRFMFNIWVDYPTSEEENLVVRETTSTEKRVPEKVLGGEEIITLQDIVRRVPVSDHVIKYATRLVRATRPKTEGSPSFIEDWVYCGAGPRACQNLILGAKARAVLDGRANVSCNDVRKVAIPVLRHRLFTNFNADSEGVSTVDIVNKLLEAVPEPQEGDYAADREEPAPPAGKGPKAPVRTATASPKKASKLRRAFRKRK